MAALEPLLHQSKQQWPKKAWREHPDGLPPEVTILKADDYFWGSAPSLPNLAVQTAGALGSD